MKKAPTGSGTSIDRVQNFKRKMAKFRVGTKWKPASLHKFQMFSRTAPSYYPYLNDAESRTLKTLFDEALRDNKRLYERYKQAEKAYLESRKQKEAVRRPSRRVPQKYISMTRKVTIHMVTIFDETIRPTSIWRMDQCRRRVLSFNRMTDRDEEVLRKNLLASQSEPIEDMDGLIKELRTHWNFLFAHGSAIYPVFCKHGKVTDSDARLNALANAFKKLDDYELGALFHLLKANTYLNSNATLDFLAAFTNAVEQVPEILKKDAGLICELSGQPDYTGVDVLVFLYERYCKRKAAPTTDGPFTRFALAVLQPRIKISQGDDSQPFRRALEALEDPDLGRASRQKYFDLSFISLPAAKACSEPVRPSIGIASSTLMRLYPGIIRDG